MTATETEPITGWAAGVPFTALPPPGGAAEPAPLVITWHMMDAPRSDAAFAAALPLSRVPAWRVHLGMPMIGRRAVAGALEAVRADPMLNYADPVVRQTADELPDVLAALRARFPLADGPIGIVGGSLGGTVALNVLARRPVPIATAALINPAVRGRTVVAVFAAANGIEYPWSDAARAAADRLDFVAHADLIAARDPQPALLVVSGELDYPISRADADELVAALRALYADPDRIRLTTIPGLDHPIADRPGDEPAPQIPLARVVDDAVTEWFRAHPPGR
jgi:dienelactone hydrolase